MPELLITFGVCSSLKLSKIVLDNEKIKKIAQTQNAGICCKMPEAVKRRCILQFSKFQSTATLQLQCDNIQIQPTTRKVMSRLSMVDSMIRSNHTMVYGNHSAK